MYFSMDIVKTGSYPAYCSEVVIDNLGLLTDHNTDKSTVITLTMNEKEDRQEINFWCPMIDIWWTDLCTLNGFCLVYFEVLYGIVHATRDRSTIVECSYTLKCFMYKQFHSNSIISSSNFICTYCCMMLATFGVPNTGLSQTSMDTPAQPIKVVVLTAWERLLTSHWQTKHRAQW